MSERRLLLGLDAGGSKTRVAVAEYLPATDRSSDAERVDRANDARRAELAGNSENVGESERTGDSELAGDSEHVDASRHVLADITGPGGDLPSLGEEGLVRHLSGLCNEALQAAGAAAGALNAANIAGPASTAGAAAAASAADTTAAAGAARPDALAAVALGLPGLGVSPQWDATMKAVARRVFPDQPVLLLNDVALAREAAFRSNPGILALAGTGAMAWGRDASGAVSTAGGWGFLFGDEGGGYDLGREGLRAASRAVDGRGPDTVLARLIPEDMGLSDLGEVVEYLARDLGRLRADTAAAARSVLSAAIGGDAVAAALVERAAGELVEQVVAVRSALADALLPVAGAGGLFESSIYREAFDRAASEMHLPARSSPTERPVEAALRLAEEVALLGTSSRRETHRGFSLLAGS